MNLVQKADLVRQLFFVNRETGHVLTFALLQMASDISSSAASPLHDSGGGGGTPSGVAAITPAVGLSSTSAHCNSEAAYQVRTFAKKKSRIVKLYTSSISDPARALCPEEEHAGERARDREDPPAPGASLHQLLQAPPNLWCVRFPDLTESEF